MAKPFTFVGSEGLLGKTIVRMLEQRTSEIVLRIGEDAFYRSNLSSRQYYNFPAAVRLSEAIAAYRFRDGAHIDSVRDLYFRVSPRSLAIAAVTSGEKRSLGATALAALGPVFELTSVGTLKSWQALHVEGKTKKEKRAQLVTFATMKLHARTQKPVRQPRLPVAAASRVAQKSRRSNVFPSAAVTSTPEWRPRLRKKITGETHVNRSPAEAASQG
jgi:hypothetical protein